MQDNQRQALQHKKDVIYAAGLLDGDGTYYINKSKAPTTNWDVDQRTGEIIYLAGLMDAEGTYYIKKCDLAHVLEGFKRVSPIYSGCIRIGMVEKEPLELLDKTFPGGKLMYEGVRKDRPNNKPMYRWELRKKALIINALEELIPYAICKKKQAILLREFLKNWKNPINRKLGIGEVELLRREQAYQEMRKLNAVGAAATTKSQGAREGDAIV